MPLFRATVWTEPDLNKVVIERQSYSPETFQDQVRQEFIGDDEDIAQVQFGPISKIDEQAREERRKGVKRGFSN
jgi:hypothetical protein